jgi:hypothetical protein
MLAATFILCIFGTYITRSGLVDSVHSFGQSLVGNFFLAFLAVTVLFCVVLLAWRIRALRGEHKLESLLGREGAFLAGNVLLCGITVVVLIGTVFPAISGGITGTRTTLNAAFYNKAFGPVAMLLAALMATGPLQGYGKEAARRLKAGVIVPAVAAVIAAAAIWTMGLHSAWAVACAAIASAAVIVIVTDLARAVIARSHHENPLLALPRLLIANQRGYGAQLAHLGIVMVLVGVVGSSVFGDKQTFQLNPGGSTNVGGTRFTLDTIGQSQGPNYTLIEAAITAVDLRGNTTVLRPQRRFYNKWQDQPSSVVAIESTWKRDLYVNLAGWDPDGKNVGLEVIVNPLVSWLWTGGWLVAIGGLICLLPRLEALFIRNTRETVMKAMKPALATSAAAIACVFAVLTASAPSTAWAQANPNLPPGHPDLSQIQGADAGADPSALPPGHPGVEGMAGATTQPVADGVVKVRAVQSTPGGPAIGDDPVTVELYVRGQLLDTSRTRLATNGTLNVTGLPVRFGIQPLVKVTHGGVVFPAVGTALDVDHPVQSLDVPVYETTTTAPDWSVTMRHVMIHPTATGIDVMEMLAITTPGDRAWVGGADKTTFSLPLAAGATDVKTSGDLDPAAVQFVGEKLVSHQALVPGEDRYQLQYTIPAHNGQAVLTAIAPAKVGHVLVFIPDDGTTVTTAGLQAMGSEQMDDKGPKTRYFMATSLQAGQSVSLTVSGLKAAAAASDATSPTGMADEPASAPAEAGVIGSSVAKAVAAIGALVILFAGALLMMVKRTPEPVKATVKNANKGRSHDRR